MRPSLSVRPYSEFLVEVVQDFDVELARSLLEAHGIETFLLDEHASTLVPIALQPPRLLVYASQSEQVFDVLRSVPRDTDDE
jgi:hypothetical protein